MSLPSGTRLGPYEVVSALGAGGMGEVYRARDSRLQREIAIKALPEGFARDAERLARFEREAQLLAALNHPNIAGIYGLEEQNGTRYLVLEYVAGETLEQRLKRGPVPVEEVLDICTQIAEAVAAAHEKGIIHRDLKPANIKVTPEGKVKVLDFGLAKDVAAAVGASGPTELSAAAASPAHTRAGIILGTAAYMSPEQARGKPVDKRADIWAFGCILYECLTGRQAFGGDTVTDVMAAIVRAEPDWTAVPAGTPRNVVRVGRRCLEKDAKRRLRDIADAGLEIGDALSEVGKGTAAEPEPPAAVSGGPRNTRVWLAWGLAALMTVVAGVALWRARGAAPAAGQFHFGAITNFAGVEAEPSLSPDGRSVAFVSNAGGAREIWIVLRTGGNPLRITNDGNLKSRPRWSPDGAQIAYSRLNDSGLWDVWVVAALGGTPRRLIANARDADWAPDGGSLVYADGSASSLWLCDPSGRALRKVTEPDGFLHRHPAFSRDGRQVAFVRRTPGPYGELAAAGVSDGKVRTLTHDGDLVLTPAWSPDGRWIYFASSRGGTVNIWRISSSSEALEQITAGRGDDAELDVSADGRSIVFSSHRGNTNLAEMALEARPGAELRKWITADPIGAESAPAYSSDGRRLAYFVNRKGVDREGIWVMDADGPNAVPVFNDSQVSVFPRWSPDGQTLLYTVRPFRQGMYSPTLELWRARPADSQTERLSESTASPFSADIGPDGRMALAGEKGQLRIVAPDGGQRAVEGVFGTMFRWAPDGKSIACLVPARRGGDPEAGVWLYDFQGPPRQLFRGWVAWFAWRAEKSIHVAEAKPDLRATLWQVPIDGTSPRRIPVPIYLRPEFVDHAPLVRFDVHPDLKRIAIEVIEQEEADIGIIEQAGKGRARAK